MKREFAWGSSTARTLRTDRTSQAVCFVEPNLNGGLVARPTLRIPVATDLALWTGDGLDIPINLEIA
jgi:hypothetical protein